MFWLGNIPVLYLDCLFLSTIVVYFQQALSSCINILISFRMLPVISITIAGSAMTQTTAHNFDVYQPRNPKASAYYQCVENHFEELEGVWDAMYASRLNKHFHPALIF
jgi:hypothetical protein